MSQNRMSLATWGDITERLMGAVPSAAIVSTRVEPEAIEIQCIEQPILGGQMSVWWQVADGWQFNIYAPRLIYEAWSIEPTTREACEEFAKLVEDLFAGCINIEVWYFRGSGEHWRTRLVDPRLAEGSQVLVTYHRRAFRWFRRVRVERGTLRASQA